MQTTYRSHPIIKWILLAVWVGGVVTLGVSLSGVDAKTALEIVVAALLLLVAIYEMDRRGLLKKIARLEAAKTAAEGLAKAAESRDRETSRQLEGSRSEIEQLKRHHPVTVATPTVPGYTSASITYHPDGPTVVEQYRPPDEPTSR